MTTELEKLKDLTERLNQPKGDWDWDIVRDVLLWSTSIFQIFGLTPATFGGTYGAFLDSVHEEDRGRVKNAVDAALDPSRSMSYSIDHRILLPNGREKTVHEEAEVFFDHKGKAIRMTGTVQDITEFGRNSEAEWRQRLWAMVEKGSLKMEKIGDKVQENALAIARLEPLTDQYKDLAKQISGKGGLAAKVASLESTSSAKLRLWTVIGGAIPATVLLLILLLTGKL